MAVSGFNERLAQANIITKTDFDAKLSSLNRKITENKTKTFTYWKWVEKTKNIWFKMVLKIV